MPSSDIGILHLDVGIVLAQLAACFLRNVAVFGGHLHTFHRRLGAIRRLLCGISHWADVQGDGLLRGNDHRGCGYANRARSDVKQTAQRSGRRGKELDMDAIAVVARPAAAV